MKKTYIIFGLFVGIILTGCNIKSLIVQDDTNNTNMGIEDPMENNEKEVNDKNTLSYDNKAEKFSIKFLSGWSFEENKYGFTTIVFSPQNDDIKENVGISVQQLQKFLSISEYHEETINNLQNTIKTFKELESKDIEKGDLKGKTITYEYTEGDLIIKSQETFLMSAENKVYIINYTATSKTFDKYLQGANTILNSFKIIE